MEANRGNALGETLLFAFIAHAVVFAYSLVAGGFFYFAYSLLDALSFAVTITALSAIFSFRHFWEYAHHEDDNVIGFLTIGGLAGLSVVFVVGLSGFIGHMVLALTGYSQVQIVHPVTLALAIALICTISAHIIGRIETRRMMIRQRQRMTFAT